MTGEGMKPYYYGVPLREIEDLSKRIFALERWGIRSPKGYDLMYFEDLKAWVVKMEVEGLLPSRGGFYDQ